MIYKRHGIACNIIVDKILVGKHRIREMLKEGGFTLALVLRAVVLLVVVLVLPLRLRFYRNVNKHKEQINNKKTTNAMHSHVDMTI